MQQEGSHLQAKERGLWRNQSCPSLDLGLPASMTGGNRCCCLSHPVCGALLWQTNQPNPSGMGGVPSYLKLTGQLALNQPQGKLRRVKKKKTEKSHEKGKGSFSRDHANQTAKAAAAASTRLGKQQSSGWGVAWPCST